MKKLTVNEIRKRYLKFFEKKDHRIFPSDSLVPQSDPTLLFTGAGMNQFKEYFLGKKKELRRATSCQKCLRTGDLDRVGHTPTHHTFFEMLGNFSFGDYFKKEAIVWGWEFLTEDLGIDPKALAVSVYTEDHEAYQIWKEVIKFPQDRIFKFGPKENFWPSNVQEDGPNGPCGPCSEIFFDRHPKKPVSDFEDERFIEIWNLVFTQFERCPNGSLKELPAKNIDTGMGLERMASVMQGTPSNFEIDTFEPIVKHILDSTRGIKVQDLKEKRAWINRIADHARAVTFAIFDGVIPSNKERGYVVRTLIRRANFSAKVLGLRTPFLNPLVQLVAHTMKEPYPDLWEQHLQIQQVVLNEEKSFEKTLEQGLAMEHEILEKLGKTGKKTLSGKDTFYLYDTLGLPLDLIRYAAAQKKISIDEAGFKKELKKQRERSKKGSQMKGDVFGEDALKKAELSLKTTFLGYETCRTEKAEVVAILKGGTPVKQATSGETIEVFLKETPFYGEQGGQIGDRGVLEGKGLRVMIEDTQHLGEALAHRGKVEKGTLRVGDQVMAAVDEKRRRDIMKNHTATHLLHSVLREKLGKHATQAGSWVGQEGLRFDFTHPKALTPAEIQEIEEKVNEHILRNDPVVPKQMSREQSRKEGAIAFFGEKYGEKVRVLEISDYSKELCGGTHIRSTGEIGQFRIVRESSVGSGIRRIEAVTGWEAYRRARRFEEMIHQIASSLKVQVDKVIEGITRLQERMKQHKQDSSKSRQLESKKVVEEMQQSKETIQNVHFVYRSLGRGYSREEATSLLDLYRQQEKGSWVTFLEGKDEEGKFFYVVGSDGRVSARDVSSAFNQATGTNGGGSPTLAKGGGGDLKKVESGIHSIKKLIEKEQQ